MADTTAMTATQLTNLLARHEIPKRKAARKLEIDERTMRKYCSGESPIPKLVEMAVLHLFCPDQIAATKAE